jgi:uncharacterized protein YacL
VFVEVMRGFVVLLGTAAGYWLARDLAPDSPTAGGIGAMLGVLIGFVSGGLFGRSIDRAMGAVERRVAPVAGPRLFAGLAVGIGGALLGGIATLPVLIHVHPALSIPIAGIVTWVLGVLGFRLGAARSDDLFAAAGLSTRPLVRAQAFDARDGYLVDTSAVMDGRFASLVSAGVIHDDLFIARFVLDELQGFADRGAEDARGRRARRGLESVQSMQREGRVPEATEVDAKLVALAQRLELRLLTADAPLARVADLRGVPALDLRRLAADLTAPVLGGEQLTVRLVKPGREPGQGVGYLEDGSMVVVNGGATAVGGPAIEVVVSSVVPNAAGRIIFARPVDEVRAEAMPSGIMEA